MPLALPIGEGWVEPAGTRQVIFPYDGTVIADAPEGSAALATSAINAALAARREVESVPAYARREVCPRRRGRGCRPPRPSSSSCSSWRPANRWSTAA
ncbi:MAG: aldehyde dehydrogenase family protein [Dermatophilaceae bacterium]